MVQAGTKKSAGLKLTDNDKKVLAGYMQAMEKRETLAKCNKKHCPKETKAFKTKADETIKKINVLFKTMAELTRKIADKKTSNDKYTKSLAGIRDAINKVNTELIESLEARKLNECSVVKCQKENVEVVRSVHDVKDLRCKLEKHKRSCEKSKDRKKILRKKTLDAKDIEAFGKLMRI